LCVSQQHLPFSRQALTLAPGACSISFKSRPYLSPRPCHNFVVSSCTTRVLTKRLTMSHLGQVQPEPSTFAAPHRL
jgi:hypothetical protein